MTITASQIKQEKEDNQSLKNLLKSQYPSKEKYFNFFFQKIKSFGFWKLC